MDFTLHQLKIFLKLVENQSITKAAEELYLTQPAVSIQLKKFQHQFDVPLTEVVGRKLYITDFGKEVAISAQKILDEIELLSYRTKSYKGILAGQIKISIVSTAKYCMPYFLSEFMHQHSAVDLVMDVTNKTKVVQHLEENAVDFAMVSVLPEHLNLNRVELMQNKLFLVGGTVLARNPKTSVRNLLKKHPLLFREKGSATRAAMEKFLEDKKIPIFKKMELTSNEALKQSVVAGLGYSIMPLIGINNELKNNDLEIIPYRGLPIVSHWNLVWLKSKRLSPAASALLEYIQKEKDKIITEKFDWFEKY